MGKRVDTKSNEITAIPKLLDMLDLLHDGPGLKSIGHITATVTKKGKTTTETRYHISSLALEASPLNEIAFQHWSLDVVFNEDKACIRNDNAAENMDILRKCAMSVWSEQKQSRIKALNKSCAETLCPLLILNILSRRPFMRGPWVALDRLLQKH